MHECGERLRREGGGDTNNTKLNPSAIYRRPRETEPREGKKEEGRREKEGEKEQGEVGTMNGGR